VRLNSHADALSKQSPYSILLISSDTALGGKLKKELNDVGGVHFTLRENKTLSAGLELMQTAKFDALVCDFDSLQAEDNFEEMNVVAPNIPVIGLSKNISNKLFEQAHDNNKFQMLPREADGLRLAVAILTAVNQELETDGRDNNVAAFLLSRLQTALESVQEHAPLNQVLSGFCAALEEFGKISLRDDFSASVLMMNSDGETLQTMAAPSLPAAYSSAINGLKVEDNAGSCGTAAFLGHPVYVSDVDTDPRWINFRSIANEHGLKACWSIPIFDDEKKVVGTFAIYHAIPRLPTSAELKLIGGAANVVSTIFAHGSKVGAASRR
jgi:hypothetical protein